MSQDKLEEIARLLGGISDKLDVVMRSLTPAQRHEVGEAMAGLGHLPEGKRGFVRSVEALRQRAEDAAKLAVRVATGKL